MYQIKFYRSIGIQYTSTILQSAVFSCPQNCGVTRLPPRWSFQISGGSTIGWTLWSAQWQLLTSSALVEKWCWGHCCWWHLGKTWLDMFCCCTSLGLLIGSDWMFVLLWSLVDTWRVDSPQAEPFSEVGRHVGSWEPTICINLQSCDIWGGQENPRNM